MADRLSMALINSLPHPLIGRQWGDKDWWWPVHDIDVETGVMRIDVSGRLQVKHLSDFVIFKDADGVEHDPDSFYLDYEEPK